MSKKPSANAQSKDFNEIVNTHTSLNIAPEEWDRTFHKWDDPMECSGRKRTGGCTICKKLDKGETVVRKEDNKSFTLKPTK